MEENYLYLFSLQSEMIKGIINLSPLELTQVLKDKEVSFLLVYTLSGTKLSPIIINTHRIISIQLLE